MAARRYELTDTQWDRIKDLIPQAKTGRPPKDDRMMLNAMLWLARSGAAWADIPARFGPHQTVYEKRVVLCVLVQVRLNALEECRAVPGGLDLAHTGDLLKFAHGGWLLFCHVRQRGVGKYHERRNFRLFRQFQPQFFQRVEQLGVVRGELCGFRYRRFRFREKHAGT